MELTPEKALIGELSTQLQEAMQARTNLGVSLRLAQARISELETENAEMKKPKRGRK